MLTLKTVKHYSDAKHADNSKRWHRKWRGALSAWRRFNRSDRHETRRQLRTS